MVNHGLVSSSPAAAHGSLHRLADSEPQDSVHQFAENAVPLEDPTECRGSKPSRGTKAQAERRIRLFQTDEENAHNPQVTSCRCHS